jgi:predicted TIM-barrel fold metal-dependent hydrolase
VYNDWVCEFCSAAPDHFWGGALLPLRGPMEWAVEEAQRMARKGVIRTFSMPASMVDRPYSRPDYEPLWATLEEIGIPVSMHIGATGEPIWEIFQRLGVGPAVVERKIMTGMRAIAELIWAGVPQRYPKLRFIVAEGGLAYVATQLTFMDHWWMDHHRWMEPKLEEAPSSYFNRQFWLTYEEERAGLVLVREGLLPVDRVMWGSDYPHTEGTFPYSQEQIAKDFAGFSEDMVYKVVVGNAASLYGLN